MVDVAQRPQSLSLLPKAGIVKGLFFYKGWKLSLIKAGYIIPGTLRCLHYGGCLTTIMRALSSAMKKGLRESTVSLVVLLDLTYINETATVLYHSKPVLNLIQ